MMAEPQQEHAWLEQLVGKWTYESKAEMGAGQEPCHAAGSETVRSLGGLWVVGEGSGDMPDGKPATMLITLGYDPDAGVYRGTWIGSMMTHLWVYEGRLDETGKVLTLDATGPSFTEPGKTARYQDVITILGPDERLLTSRSLADDGTWHEFMQARYRRA
jgi:hypothetical protein